MHYSFVQSSYPVGDEHELLYMYILSTPLIVPVVLTWYLPMKNIKIQVEVAHQIYIMILINELVKYCKQSITYFYHG